MVLFARRKRRMLFSLFVYGSSLCLMRTPSFDTLKSMYTAGRNRACSPSFSRFILHVDLFQRQILVALLLRRRRDNKCSLDVHKKHGDGPGRPLL
jgi:hypothetical protein